jgi:hypothetical protein
VRLREKFAQAGMGVSGVNLGVASTGTVCIVENEGNARLVTSQPRIHVAVMGMERVVADWDEAAHILQVLPMAAIGQDAANYVNLITGPRREGEADGPEEFHLVIVHGVRGGALVHPVRRMPVLVPHVEVGGRPSLRLTLFGPHRGGHHAAAGRARVADLARPAVHVVAVRRLRRGLPRGHTPAGPAGARAGTGLVTCHPQVRHRVPRLEPPLAAAHHLPGMDGRVAPDAARAWKGRLGHPAARARRGVDTGA